MSTSLPRTVPQELALCLLATHSTATRMQSLIIMLLVMIISTITIELYTNPYLRHQPQRTVSYKVLTIHFCLNWYFCTLEEFSASYGCINLQVSIEDNVAYAYGRRDSATCDSELEDNPLYGGEAVVLASPHDQYDQTFQPPQTPVDGEFYG